MSWERQKHSFSKPKPINERIKQIQTQIVPPRLSESKTRRPFRTWPRKGGGRRRAVNAAVCGAWKIAVFWYWRKIHVLDFGGKNVALCGAMKNSCFLMFYQKSTFSVLEKKLWRYVAVWKTVFFSGFFLPKNCISYNFGEKKCGAVWRFEKQLLFYVFQKKL